MVRMIDKRDRTMLYTNVKKVLYPQEDILLICQDYKTHGGYSAHNLNAATRLR
jgi:hypothetical protein